MSYEVDFLPVGSRYQSGDAVTVRWGRPGAYKVLVYDGGSTDAGQALVSHVKARYRTSHVDYVISSHPDGDHASGLAVLMKRLQVGELWMHRPWHHDQHVERLLHAPGPAEPPLARLRSKLRAAHRLELAARQRGVPVREPFQGASIGVFQVLSPSRDWYLNQLLPGFLQPGDNPPPSEPAPAETWADELLSASAQTSPDNESSVVLWAEFDGQGVLLTGDGGPQALHQAADHALALGLDLPGRLRWLQVPHHGCRHHLTPAVLDRLVGPRRPGPVTAPARHALISAGAGSRVHPHPMVINALWRRGVTPVATRGQRLSFGAGREPQQAPLPFGAAVGPNGV